MDDFLGVYNNAYSNEYCDSIIKLYEQLSSSNAVFKRTLEENKNDINKEDTSVSFNTVNCPLELSNFFKKFWEDYYKDYADNFKVLNQLECHDIQNIKIQKTLPKQGYHIWHSENNHYRLNKDRVLTWILYLNDVEEGGETEFLYLSKRVKPKKGTLLIFPAYFTHVHRGNPPLSGEKYIMTGWVEVS